MRVQTNKLDRQHGKTFAKGGETSMHKKQAASPNRGGHTGKIEGKAPGARSARGGDHPSKFRPVRPARAGATSSR